MSSSLRLLAYVLLSPLGLATLPAASYAAVTNSSNELVVESFRLENAPQSCSSTLFVTIRNTGAIPTDSGLFMHTSQYRSLGGTLRRSSMMPTQRVAVLASGQTGEAQVTFIRESDKTNIEFRFMVGPDTVALADRPLPPFTDTYAGTIASHRLDSMANQVQGTIKNTGSTPIPKPTIQLDISRKNAPASFTPSGGGIVSNCLLPGATATFTRPVSDPGTIAAYKLHLLAGGTIKLDEKSTGQATTKRLLIPKQRLETPQRILPR